MNKIQVDKIVIRFVGDSGDGIQLIGNQISDSSVVMSGNDIYTFVDFPSEIRAPAGSLSGVSGFQVSISSEKLYAVEDKVDLLVAFNPAALKNNISFLKKNGILIIDLDSFNDKNLKKASFAENPIFDGSLDSFKLIKAPITKLTYDCVKDIIPIVSKAKRCKNFFVLGLVCWLYDRKLDSIISWLSKKFGSGDIFIANKKVLQSGYNYGDNLELFQTQTCIPPSGLYDDGNVIKISGNKAFSIGAMASSVLMDMPLFSANYPITPSSDVLHELSCYFSNNMKILQLEDEIAAINAVIGASYGGALSFTCTSGPGLDLMQEGLGLSIMSELPVVLLNVQRSGPSTGIPTKSEQTDLLSAIFGRHGEAHAIVLAPKSPVDCFWTIIEGFALSIFYLGPVIILSDGNLANSSEIWNVPSIDDVKNKFNFKFLDFKKTRLNEECDDDGCIEKNWIVPGKSGYKCSIGGLERDINTGNVSHDSENHFKMIKKRHNKFNSIASKFFPLNIIGKKNGDVLVITWGSAYGMVRSVYNDIVKTSSISLLCLRYLNPLPNDLNGILASFRKILVVEENLGQLAFILRSKYLIDVISINQVTGRPFEFNGLKCDILRKI